MFVIKTPILKFNSIKLLRFLYKLKTLTCMYIEAKKSISIKMSSKKKKRKWKRKRKRNKEKVEKEEERKKGKINYQNDGVQYERPRNGCQKGYIGAANLPIQHNMPLGRAKLVPVWYAPFIHSAQYTSLEGQIGVGLVCAIHSFGTICLLGGPNWYRINATN